MINITAEHEGGCLDRAIRCGENFYALELRPDTWYYFNFKITGCKDKEIIFQFTCRDLDPGPRALSTPQDQGRDRWNYGDWIVEPSISYDNGKTWERTKGIFKKNGVKGTYCFKHTFKEDTAIVSHAPTYTYTDLCNYLKKFEDIPFVKIGSIGKTRVGVDTPRLTITKNPDSRETIVIISREDADEMTGSFAAEGYLDYLVSGAEEVEAALNKYIFEIIPMVGIDGVIAGCTHSAGYGYGGQWWHYEDEAPQEVKNVKNFIRELAKSGQTFPLTGKIHGYGHFSFPNSDYIANNKRLYDALDKNASGWIVDPPNKYQMANSMGIREKGLYERFMLDEFDPEHIFCCHIGGLDQDGSRAAGKGLMQNILELL